MDKLSRLVGIVACAAALAAAGCSSNSGVTPSTGSPMTTQQQAASNAGWIHDGGVTYHVPHYMATRYMSHPDVKPDIQLVYGGGPVLVNPKMYLIFWGFKSAGDPNKVKALLKNYAKHVGGSAYNNIYTQYYMKVGSVTTFVTNPSDQGDKNSFWADNTQSHPGAPDGFASCLRSARRRCPLRLRSKRFVRRRDRAQPQLVGLWNVLLRVS